MGPSTGRHEAFAIPILFGLMAAVGAIGQETANQEPAALPASPTANSVTAAPASPLGPPSDNLPDAPERVPVAPIGPLEPPADGGAADLRQRLRAPNAIAVTDRHPNRLEVRWHDRTDVETGYEVEKRIAGDEWRAAAEGDWEVLESLGPRSEWTTVSDTAVEPDRLFCYRVQVFDETRRIPSAERCAYTPDGRGFEANRIQLKVMTGDVENAGTDDDVRVRLNSQFKSRPSTPEHWLDYSHDDFERASTFTYDLDPRFIHDLSDITAIELFKPGDDDWCVAGLELEVDDRIVFEQRFESVFETGFEEEDATCHWLREDTERTLRVPFRALRSHIAWRRYQPMPPVLRIVETPLPGGGVIPPGRRVEIFLTPGVLGIRGEDLRSRISSVVGHELHFVPAFWPAAPDDGNVVVGRRGERSVGALFNFRAGFAAASRNVLVSLQLDFDLSCDPRTHRVNLVVQLEGFDAQVFDFPTIPGISLLDDKIEATIEDLGISFDVRRSELLDDLLSIDAECGGTGIVVDDDGTVNLSLELIQRFQSEAPTTEAPVVAPVEGSE